MSPGLNRIGCSRARSKISTGVHPTTCQPVGFGTVVGRTPVEIFDLAREQPILFKPGDKVNLRRIARDEFDALSAQVDEGSFDMAGLRQP